METPDTLYDTVAEEPEQDELIEDDASEQDESLEEETAPTSDPADDPQSAEEDESSSPVDDTVADALGLPPQSSIKTKQAYIDFILKRMLGLKEELAATASTKAPVGSKPEPSDTEVHQETDTAEPQQVPSLPSLMSPAQIAAATAKWADEGDAGALGAMLDDMRNGQDHIYQHAVAKVDAVLAENKRLGSRLSDLESKAARLEMPLNVQNAIAKTEGAIDADAPRAMQFMDEGLPPERAAYFAMLERVAKTPASPAPAKKASDTARRKAGAVDADQMRTNATKPVVTHGLRYDTDPRDVFEMDDVPAQKPKRRK